MPLFRANIVQDRGLQLQEVICPFCKASLEPVDELHSSGDGLAMRVIEGEYKCPCGYEVKVTEKYPIIRRVPDGG